MLKQTALYLSILFLTSCWGIYRQRPAPNPEPDRKVLGYKPVYSNDSSLLLPRVMPVQPVNEAGKIYVKGNLIFQNELGDGIHVIDNSDPAAAKRIGYIRLLGNTEMSIKGNFLYANSFADLVIIDISNWQNPVQVKRLKYAFQQGATAGRYNFIPLPERGVHYECPNFYFGIQTGWKKDSVWNYGCYYP
jgi:hypothetical protein